MFIRYLQEDRRGAGREVDHCPPDAPKLASLSKALNLSLSLLFSWLMTEDFSSLCEPSLKQNKSNNKNKQTKKTFKNYKYRARETAQGSRALAVLPEQLAGLGSQRSCQAVHSYLSNSSGFDNSGLHEGMCMFPSPRPATHAHTHGTSTKREIYTRTHK